MMETTTAPRRLFALCWVSCLSWLLTGPVAAQTLFTDVTEQVGLDAFIGRSARNVVFVDYDNDGFQDVFVCENRYTTPRRSGLFHNTGDGRFVDQTFRLPTDHHLANGSGGAIFGDYDNDGDEDLFLPEFPHNVLLRNDRGLFTRVDAGSDLTDSLWTANALWLDYDRDGYLDLYIGSYRADETYALQANRLMRNNGNETFTDQTAAAGLEILFHPEIGGSWGGMAAGDFNDDGWPDIYVGVPGYSNRLFLNDGAGGFQDATSGDIGDEGDAFTLTIGDIDNDGDLDIFQAAGGTEDEGSFRSLMLLNLGDGQFLDVTEGVGLGVGVVGISTNGVTFADVDNDGDLDLFVGMSLYEESDDEPFPLLLLNDGSGTFVDQTAASGIEDFGAYVAVGDYDEDGFVDLLFASFPREVNALYRNSGNENHWLRVELVGIESNRNGIGSRVLATSDELVQMREILGGVGRQEDERVAHFGLGDRTQVDHLEIRWPSGQVDILSDIPADQKIRVFEGREGFHVVQPTRWEHNLPDEVTRKAQRDIAIAVWPARFDPDAAITRVTADLSELGGPVDLPLESGEEGIYRLDTSLEVDAPRGAYTAYINIEQRTSLGDHWVQLAKTLTVLPDEDVDLFGGGGEEDWAWHGQDLMRLTDHPETDYVSSWSPDGTRLTFQTYRDGNGEIYVIDADGGDPTNLTNDPAYDGFPAWSPDGTKIAFYSNREGDYEIHVMDADGGNPTNLTMLDGYDFYPSWSPDGTQIAFQTYRDGNLEIYAMDADGGNQTNLTNNDARDGISSWSPDGTRIAFQSYREGEGELYVLDLETGNVTKLTEGFVAPASAWSPDGTQIVFESERSGNLEIYVIDADGGDPIEITHHPEGDMNAVWSPTGNRIAFVSKRVGNWDLFILSMDEASRVEIDPEERGTVFTGSTALAVRTGADWWLSCQPAAPFDWTGYGALSFAFHPGDLSASSGEELSVWIRGKEVDLLSEGRIDLAEKKWQVVEIPFEQFELRESIAAVDFSGDFTGSFFIDDLRLVPAKPSSSESTAVVEEDATGLPSTFALEQNYPNPFNANTVISFSLPERRDVELAIFNLTGQQVATLVEGERQAGTYVLHWDGRDADGQPLASGVYLYRLGVGEQQVETRKLLLLR
ncbi:MAG: T9SS type A sorting domain-containing protein [Gemmatimonadetes bacterium]|jgi:Tol biopolymer transport system component|nr:T9SS type A sorting domain-containing protein [Gemmatimonadota bacterium]